MHANFNKAVGEFVELLEDKGVLTIKEIPPQFKNEVFDYALKQGLIERKNRLCFETQKGRDFVKRFKLGEALLNLAIRKQMNDPQPASKSAGKDDWFAARLKELPDYEGNPALEAACEALAAERSGPETVRSISRAADFLHDHPIIAAASKKKEP